MATTNTSTSVEGAAVHDTLSPTERTHRRDSLEKHLLSRPSPQDLKEKHILLSTDAAPSLQAKQAELDKARATDSLRKGLEHRSERDDLVQRNILPNSPVNMAPALASSQKALERHMRADSLEKALQHRPSPNELVREGILEKDEVAGEEQAVKDW